MNVRAFLCACLRFFVHESCGNCNPCRNGLTALLEIATRLKARQGYAGDIEIMETLAMTLKSAAICPLGQSPASPIMSALRYFREEIEAGIDTQAVRPKLVRNARELAPLAAV